MLIGSAMPRLLHLNGFQTVNRRFPLENLAVLQGFGVKGRAYGLQGGGRDERIISAARGEASYQGTASAVP